MCVCLYLHVRQCWLSYMCVHTCVCLCVCVCACVHVACNLLHGSHVQPSVFTHVTPPMHSLHKYTHTQTYTHTYMPTSHLLSLPSVLFSPISPLCPTQGSRLADVMTTSCMSWPTQSTTCRTMFIACAHVSLFSHSIIPYLFLYVFVLVDYVFFPIPLTM